MNTKSTIAALRAQRATLLLRLREAGYDHFSDKPQPDTEGYATQLRAVEAQLNQLPKLFASSAAHGDVLFLRINTVPKDAQRDEAFNGVVAHSETGHHHKFEHVQGLTYFRTEDPTVAYLRMEQPNTLLHFREAHNHAPIAFEAGTYKVCRPVEYVSPREMRMVQD